jgi:transcriptional regulator with GAF, ATPase, and Fis domain
MRAIRRREISGSPLDWFGRVGIGFQKTFNPRLAIMVTDTVVLDEERRDIPVLESAFRAPQAASRDVMLEVWREASRHPDIQAAAESITRVIGRELPLRQVVVRRLDLARSRLETVALGVNTPNYLRPDAHTDLGKDQVESLQTWAAQGRWLHARRDASVQGLLGLIVPVGLEGDALVCPLRQAGETLGFLILLAVPSQQFEPEHAAKAYLLAEPFAVALSHHLRIREIAAIRAAAETEKRSIASSPDRNLIADTVVGWDAGLRGVVERVELVAKSDVPALILGETGTGKEVIARLIHSQSRRTEGPFLRVNCGAIPLELIDSQLFGHEKGAFTGAVETRQGWFERANGGTLLLDEIGELPLAAQVRLLRILQDGWLERVGGSEPSHVDVRIIAATHRDLAAMVAEGRFREDLWYRIAVFPILLPPLRERREDIPELARHFASQAAARFMLPPVYPTPEDIRLLASYPWPGNIRELGAVIDRAAILGNGQRLDVAKSLGIPTSHVAAAAATHPATPTTPYESAQANPARSPVAKAGEFLSLDDAIRHHVEAALAATHGQIEGRRGAAALLKINPHTLRAKMRKLGIDWSVFRPQDD